MAPCPACGTQNPDVARFCMGCGGPLAGVAPTPSRDVRKVVTVGFADVTGSTGLGERLDPESMRATMGRWFEAMRGVLERHGDEAVRLTDEALAMGASTDSLAVADVWLARAQVFSLADQRDGSRAAATEARAIWAAKGHANGILWAEAWI